MSRRHLVAFGVDLDEIECYRAIHGLGEVTAGAPIYDAAVPRFAELFGRAGIPATFFVVGRDAARPERAARLRELASAGHELANHSLTHPYDLVRRSPAVIVSEVAGGRAAVEDAVGVKVAGFRAPGYTLSAELVEILVDLGVAWDSSVLPSPAYFAARTGAILWKAVRGRHSRSLPAGFDLALSPRRPYRMGWPPFVRQAPEEAGTVRSIPEMPIAVLPFVRIPFIGTTFSMFGPDWTIRLAATLEGQPLINIELHGIDLCAPDDPGMQDIVGHQPDAAVPLERKRNVLQRLIARFREAGAEFVTLSTAASILFQKPLKG